MKLSEKVFRVWIEFQNQEREKRMTVSPQGNRLVGGSKRMNEMREYRVLIPCYGEFAKSTNRKALQIAMLTMIILSVGVV